MNDSRLSLILKSLLELSPTQFEQVVADVWEGMGWNTSITNSTNDDGVDIYASKFGVYEEKAAIQAKRYNPGNKVGRPDIQQYDTLRRQDPDVDFVIIVTTSEFTHQAEQLSSQLNVKTINGRELALAALNHLPDDYISGLLENETQPTSINGSIENTDDSHVADFGLKLHQKIPPEDLSPHERELAEIYKSHWEERTEKYGGTPASSLVFEFKEDNKHVEVYQVLTGLHSIQFYEIDYMVKNYHFFQNQGWEMDVIEYDESQADSKQIDTSVFNLSKKSEKNVINLKPNGKIGDDLDPYFEARFTTILVEYVLDISLDSIHEITKQPFENDNVETFKLEP